MTTRYFRHQACEPDDEVAADEAARLPHHVRRREVEGGAIVERVRDGAVIEVIYERVEAAGHAAHFGAVPHATVRELAADGGRVRERIEVGADGAIRARSLTHLDDGGRPSLEEWFDAGGAPTSHDVYTWRDDDLIRVVTHQADGKSFVAYEDEDADG